LLRGSLVEAEYLIMLSRDLDYLTPASVAPLLAEIKELAAMLHYLRMKVEKKPFKSQKVEESKSRRVEESKS
jgi:hypothetical protein